MHERSWMPSSLFTRIIDQSIPLILLLLLQSRLLLLAPKLGPRGAIYELQASSCRRACMPTKILGVMGLFIVSGGHSSPLRREILVSFLELAIMVAGREL